MDVPLGSSISTHSVACDVEDASSGCGLIDEFADGDMRMDEGETEAMEGWPLVDIVPSEAAEEDGLVSMLADDEPGTNGVDETPLVDGSLPSVDDEE